LAVGCWLLSVEALAQRSLAPIDAQEFVSGGPVECCFNDGCITLEDADCMREQDRRHQKNLAALAEVPQELNDEPVDLELQHLDLAEHPGSHVVLVEECIALADTKFRVSDQRDQNSVVCRVVFDTCRESIRADVIWRLPKFVGSPGKPWMRAPIARTAFRISLRPGPSEDGLPMVGYAQPVEGGVQCE
jgi:hypothetical protein